MAKRLMASPFFWVRRAFVWVINGVKEISAQVRQKGVAPSVFAFDRRCRCEGDAKAKAEGAERIH